MTPIPYHNAPGGLGLVWQRYVEHGIMPGHFCSCILKNDLIGAVRHADIVQRDLIHATVLWLWNAIPMEAWGTFESYCIWAGKGGMAGMYPEEFINEPTNIVYLEFKKQM